jgi:hypothetical protein
MGGGRLGCDSDEVISLFVEIWEVEKVEASMQRKGIY